ncbi:MAG TPA: threonine synthase [Dehalococcoidia bacterium]
MRKIRGLHCVLCGSDYAYGEVEYTCPKCGTTGILDVQFDYDWLESNGFGAKALAARTEGPLARYIELLPIEDAADLPSLQFGPTPLYRFPKLASTIGVAELLVKDDGRMPTASFKDRASAIAVARAREKGYSEIACASTGNAASSLAGMSANTGLRAHIFVPATAPEAKVAQLQIFGADVLLVEGTYDQAYDLCMEACREFGWFNRNCAINPYLVEGKKTCGLELGEQLGQEPVDWVAVSVGDGCTVAGVWKGLVEMHRFGVLAHLPRILGVQASGASPLVDAFARGSEDFEPGPASTLADSIAVGHPRNAVKALRAVRESGGTLLAVEDDAILEAMKLLATSTGVFGEPAGVAAFAGVTKAVDEGLITAGAKVVHVVTGNGLKDVKAAFRATGEPRRIGLSLDEVRAAVASSAQL